MDLTIAIPTYNRNELLLRHLAHLLPQLNERCRLLILDNCSPTPVSETLRDLLQQYPHIDAQLVRNKFNIGANANILRCLELCETPWVWILGDDDLPLPNAIETILEHTEKYASCLYLNFGFDGLRKQTIVTRGIEDFANKLDTSANIPWISSAILNAQSMQTYLKLGYQYAYSMLPHVAILLMSLGKSGECCLSKEQIIDVTQLRQVSFESEWSRIDLALGSPVLFDLPLQSRVRKQIARKLLVTHYGESLKLRVIIHQLLLMSLRNKDPKTSFYLYDQIRRRSYYYEKRPKRQLALALGWVMLRVPRLTSLLYKVVKKKDFLKESLQDRYERI